MEKYKIFSWNHQAIFTIIRSAANIFLMQLLGAKLLQNEQDIVNEIERKTIEERTTNAIKWFMHNDTSDKPKHSTSPKAKVLDTCKRTKHQKEANILDSHKNLDDTNQEK